MSKRFDVMAPRPGREEGKTFWHRVGTAWEGEKGIGIEFDSLPIPDKEGKVKVRLFEPREKSQGAERGERSVAENPARTSPAHPFGPSMPSQISTKYGPDDDIPF